MHKRRWCLLLLLSPLMITILCCLGFMAMALLYSPELEKSESPGMAFRESDLVGTWKAEYSSQRIDWLILRPDGTFKQVYINQIKGEYRFETSWNKWWVERFPDGRVWVHLEGARYYRYSTEMGEWRGLLSGTSSESMKFFDPFGDEWVEMVDKLVLNVRRLPNGDLVLAHMWLSPDGPLGDKDAFYREITPATPLP